MRRHTKRSSCGIPTGSSSSAFLTPRRQYWGACHYPPVQETPRLRDSYDRMASHLGLCAAADFLSGARQAYTALGEVIRKKHTSDENRGATLESCSSEILGTKKGNFLTHLTGIRTTVEQQAPSEFDFNRAGHFVATPEFLEFYERYTTWKVRNKNMEIPSNFAPECHPYLFAHPEDHILECEMVQLNVRAKGTGGTVDTETAVFDANEKGGGAGSDEADKKKEGEQEATSHAEKAALDEAASNKSSTEAEAKKEEGNKDSAAEEVKSDDEKKDTTTSSEENPKDTPVTVQATPAEQRRKDAEKAAALLPHMSSSMLPAQLDAKTASPQDLRLADFLGKHDVFVTVDMTVAVPPERFTRHYKFFYDRVEDAETEKERSGIARLLAVSAAYPVFRAFDSLIHLAWKGKVSFYPESIPLKLLGLSEDFLEEPIVVRKRMTFQLSNVGWWRISGLSLDGHYIIARPKL